jgi:hypothetical protein
MGHYGLIDRGFYGWRFTRDCLPVTGASPQACCSAERRDEFEGETFLTADSRRETRMFYLRSSVVYRFYH